MTVAAPKKSNWQPLAIVVAIACVLISVYLYYINLPAQPEGGAKHSTVLTWVLWGLRSVLVILMLVFGWRDIGLLFRKPAKNMGMGIGRVWAVARTTIFEAWAGRVWMLPVLWLILSSILIGTIRPFDDSERIPLYIRMLLSGQQYLVMVMLWVMACVSLPRERERKIMITTASKPLSRLEIILGKITGFSVVAGGCLLVMGILSLIILYIADYRFRGEAGEHYRIQQRDFAQTFKTPQENLKQISEEGSLFAHNFITVPRDAFSIVGAVAVRNDGRPPVRFLKGGSAEKVSYRFSPRIYTFPGILTEQRGTRPYFEFTFPPSDPANPSRTNFPPIDLRVTAYRSSPHVMPRLQEKLVRLTPSGEGGWEPDNPEELFSIVNEQTEPYEGRDLGEVTVDVQCVTPGVYLQILEGVAPDQKVFQREDFNVFARPARRYDAAIPPREHPIMRGFERRDRQEIASVTKEEGPGGSPEFALYRFPGSSLRNVPVDKDNTFALSVQFETYRSDNPNAPTQAVVRVITMDNPSDKPYAVRFEVPEKRVKPLKIDAAMLGNPDPTKRGDMYVMVFADTPNHSISLIENSVRIELPASPFFMNLLKAEMILFLQAVLVVVVSVACSIRFGWPVAMLLSMSCILFGIFAGFIAGLQEYGGLGALNYNVAPIDQTAAYKFLDTTAAGIWQALALISALLPDFTVYQPQAYIPNLQDTPWAVIGINFVQTLTFSLPFVGLAYLMFRKQELG